jgi:hypothetical protein
VGSCDDVYYDAERKRIYALGEGFISVIQQNDPDHYMLSANIPSAVGVRTGIFFGTSLYVSVPASGLEPTSSACGRSCGRDLFAGGVLGYVVPPAVAEG